MASIKELGKGKYRVFICNGFNADGKVNRTSKVISAKSLKDAGKQAQALEVDFRRGEQIQFSNAPTFLDLANKWRELKKGKLELHTQIVYEGFLNTFMIPYFGRMKVRDIKGIHIDAYINTLKQDGVRKNGKSGGYSEKTIRHHYMFIQTLFNQAVKWDIIEYNPCLKAESPKVHKKEAKYYNEETIDRLLDCVDAEYQSSVTEFREKIPELTLGEYQDKLISVFNHLMHKTYIWLALASACRRGELLGMKLEDVDFDRSLITIQQTCHYSPQKCIYVLPYLKNGSPSKQVDMPETVMRQLRGYLDARRELLEFMDWEDSGYVFISLKDGKMTQAGGPMMPDVISRWFKRFIQANNLPAITLHQVRHTSISYLINHGVDIKMVADRAGHQNTRTTEETYGHIYNKTKRATADKYDNLFQNR